MRGIEQIPWLYDAFCAIGDATGLARWRQWLTAGARGRVLEIGCGTGRNLPLYETEAPVVGIDPGMAVLRRARRRSSAAHLVQARAEALPFRSGAFDTVVSSLVFCSVPDVRAGFSEIRRVLAEGGHLRMLEHVRSDRRLKARLQDAIQPAWTRVTGGCHPNRDTEAAVTDAGFEISDEGYRARGTMRRLSAHPVA